MYRLWNLSRNNKWACHHAINYNEFATVYLCTWNIHHRSSHAAWTHLMHGKALPNKYIIRTCSNLLRLSHKSLDLINLALKQFASEHSISFSTSKEVWLRPLFLFSLHLHILFKCPKLKEELHPWTMFP